VLTVLDYVWDDWIYFSNLQPFFHFLLITDRRIISRVHPRLYLTILCNIATFFLFIPFISMICFWIFTRWSWHSCLLTWLPLICMEIPFFHLHGHLQRTKWGPLIRLMGNHLMWHLSFHFFTYLLTKFRKGFLGTLPTYLPT